MIEKELTRNVNLWLQYRKKREKGGVKQEMETEKDKKKFVVRM